MLKTLQAGTVLPESIHAEDDVEIKHRQDPQICWQVMSCNFNINPQETQGRQQPLTLRSGMLDASGMDIDGGE